jgi:hypothetical protein
VPPIISYCTSCMGRLWQLKKTLPINIKQLENDEELCLVNYNSNDGLHEYIVQYHVNDIVSGKLRYFFTTEPKIFHMSKAKNLSHRVSQGQFVFNLDADNFINKDTRAFFKSNTRSILHERVIGMGGTWGRIGMSREIFFEIGGYDETFMPMGYQDIDLLKRLSLKGYDIQRIRSCEKPIQQKNIQKTLNVGGIDIKELIEINKEWSKFKLKNGLFVSNKAGFEKFIGYLNCRDKMVI